MVVLVQHWFDVLRPSIQARVIAEANTISMIILIWFILRIIELVRYRITHTMEGRGNEHATVLIRPAATAVKIVVLVVAVMVWIENLGFKATTLIAGLGVGGLAVALAAQKSVENLIGAITLYMSAPVKVGDFCKFGGQVGTVEEINLRATRIRTPDDTLIAVPNAIFSEMILENISKRQKVRYNPHLCLSHKATPEQVSAVLEGIRGELEGRPDIDQENLYVRFEDFGERGLDFKSLIFVTTQNYQEYLGVAECLNLRIMDIVEKAGTELAEPLYRTVASDG
jgi:MscS family membrane protein